MLDAPAEELSINDPPAETDTPSSGRTSRREKKSLHISNAFSDPRF